jgi:ATP-dependent protease ClpP protease subunit
MSNEADTEAEEIVHRREQREEDSAFLEAVAAFHEHSVFVPSRTLYMGSVTVNLEGYSGTDSKMAEAFIKNLHVLEALSSDPVTVIMDNPGGDFYHGIAIYDAIKQSPCEITIQVRGHAMSMGSLILQAATKRVMGPMATQMLHYGYMSANHDAKTFQKWAQEADRLDTWAERVYLNRIRAKQPEFTLEALQKLLTHDTFLTAEQSIELGLADIIG